MQPLADLCRPTSFDEMVGQAHLVGPNGTLRRLCEGGHLTNMIFYGPPGVGKTTAASILAANTEMQLYRLNATTASLSDIRDVIAGTETMFGRGGILLYLDEIQYFNKKQQQSLLEFIEDGRITLIASTTENPYFYVYGALLSRSACFEFKPVRPEEIVPMLRRAHTVLEERSGLSHPAEDAVLLAIASLSGGDVRRAIGILENAYYTAEDALTEQDALALSPGGVSAFDRDGDGHYDLLSGLQKSIRGSDPDAAIFYLAKLLEGGDLFSACRRLLVIASEDIGQAYPLAAVVTQSCVQSARELGLPEAKIPLSNAAILLATAPKSNSANEAYGRAAADVNAGKGNRIPDDIRDAHYEGAEKLGRGEGYRYPHAFENHYCKQRYLPTDLGDVHYYFFGDNKTEQAAAAYWEKVKGEPQPKE